MNALIVETRFALARLWQRHMQRQGITVDCANSQDEAIEYLGSQQPVDVIILNVLLEGGSAFAVADYAQYRQPDARVIFVNDSRFFSDGSIFSHAANACAFIPSGTPPDDLAAMVEHYGMERAPQGAQ